MNESNERAPSDHPGADDLPIAPDDLALMRWLDGDLDEDEAMAFEARLEEDDELAAKRWGLELGAELVDELVEADERADGVADAVMARLDKGDVGAEADPAERSPEPVKLEAPVVPRASEGPANDNSRSIFGLAAGAAAVAAGLFLWGMQGQEADQARRPPVRRPPVAIAEGPEAAEAAAEPSSEVADDEDDPGVEVAAVDFGSHSGSVFYVAGGETSTAVVWITDAGEE